MKPRRDLENDRQNSSPRLEPTHWFSRGYLPHFDQPNLVQAITFRLADSLPKHILEKMAGELAKLPESSRQVAREQRIAAYLDAGHGACWLQDAQIADVVESALLHFDGQRYRLLAWCVMPNHVHALVETREGAPLAQVVHSWKSFTATRSNRILGRTGDFWQREYHDRFIRDEEHFRNAVTYIENNPVKAGLAKASEAWRCTSARYRAGSAGLPQAREGRSRLEAGAPSTLEIETPPRPCTVREGLVRS